MWPAKANSKCVAGMTDVCGLSLSLIVWGFKCGGRTYLTQTTVSLSEKKEVLHRHIQLRHPPWCCMYAEIKPKRLVWQVIINSQSEFSSLELNNASITKQTASLHKLQYRQDTTNSISLYYERWCLRSTCLIQLHLTRLHWIVLKIVTLLPRQHQSAHRTPSLIRCNTLSNFRSALTDGCISHTSTDCLMSLSQYSNSKSSAELYLLQKETVSGIKHWRCAQRQNCSSWDSSYNSMICESPPVENRGV